jgi:O-methyltransferase involved in polyketide biosynthesis
MEHIPLSGEMETLLIPLYGKAMESRKRAPCSRTKNEEIVERSGYDFQSLHIQEKTNLFMCIRAKLLDDFARSFLRGGEPALVLHLGCGLDSR